jgi:precorrin-8X/cobalt-precorrin-8 methylmutase
MTHSNELFTHPIEAESYRVLEARLDLSHLEPGPRAVVARVVHATADAALADTMCVTPEAVRAGVAALAGEVPVVVDVEMVRAGIGLPAECFLAEARVGRSRGPTGTRVPTAPAGTLSAAAMELAVARHPDGAVFVIGCAPTALERLLDLVGSGAARPALVVGVPVGFVGAAEAKERLRASPVCSISNVGERGGSAVAAAVVNALWRLAQSPATPRP